MQVLPVHINTRRFIHLSKVVKAHIAILAAVVLRKQIVYRRVIFVNLLIKEVYPPS